jgi:hypothetical protein
VRTPASLRKAEMINNLGDARITAGAERMRISRQRRREGMRCVMIELRDSEIDQLVALGLLTASSRDDINAVAQALYRFLDQSPIGCAHQHQHGRSNAVG